MARFFTIIDRATGEHIVVAWCKTLEDAADARLLATEDDGPVAVMLRDGVLKEFIIQRPRRPILEPDSLELPEPWRRRVRSWGGLEFTCTSFPEGAG